MNVAVRVAVVLAVTGAVLTVKDPVVCPAEIVTVDGTVAAAELFELRAITVSAAAGVLRVITAVATPPPVTVAGAIVAVINVKVPIASKFLPSYTKEAVSALARVLRGE